MVSSYDGLVSRLFVNTILDAGSLAKARQVTMQSKDGKRRRHPGHMRGCVHTYICRYVNPTYQLSYLVCKPIQEPLPPSAAGIL